VEHIRVQGTLADFGDSDPHINADEVVVVVWCCRDGSHILANQPPGRWGRGSISGETVPWQGPALVERMNLVSAKTMSTVQQLLAKVRREGLLWPYVDGLRISRICFGTHILKIKFKTSFAPQRQTLPQIP